uniref:Uncharacterized protein n=1 Tax=Anopheles atroparvus TaxID=41427 RepID=A0A182J104_ANOAO
MPYAKTSGPVIVIASDGALVCRQQFVSAVSLMCAPAFCPSVRFWARQGSFRAEDGGTQQYVTIPLPLMSTQANSNQSSANGQHKSSSTPSPTSTSNTTSTTSNSTRTGSGTSGSSSSSSRRHLPSATVKTEAID